MTLNGRTADSYQRTACTTLFGAVISMSQRIKNCNIFKSVHSFYAYNTLTTLPGDSNLVFEVLSHEVGIQFSISELAAGSTTH